MATHRIAFNRPLGKQAGAALLILLTIVVLASGYALLKQLNKERPEILRASDTAAVLAEAKAALVGYALSSTTPSNQPGRLPCPDYDLDGLSDDCAENITYVAIGRLPWKTLGLPNLRDASGESLWYAPDMNFDGNSPINSETSANLRVVTNNTEQIAAVIIAPGKVTSTQSRPQNLAAQTTPARYLEASNAVADINISVMSPTPTTEFTDQVLVISRDELMQVVERRVLAELKTVLNGFAPLPEPSPNDGVTTTCTGGTTQGLLPLDCGTPPLNVGNWPSWFTANGWRPLIWYAVDNVSSSITVDGSGPIQALLFAAGPLINGQTAGTPRTLPNLLDHPLNYDGTDLAFVDVPISATNNDQLLIVK